MRFELNKEVMYNWGLLQGSGVKTDYLINFVVDNEGEKKYLKPYEIIELLNKQQNTIFSLENEVERQKNEIKLIRQEYTKIPPKIREVWRD